MKPRPTTPETPGEHRFKLAAYGVRWLRSLGTEDGDRWASAITRGDGTILEQPTPDLSNAPTGIARLIHGWLSMNRPGGVR